MTAQSDVIQSSFPVPAYIPVRGSVGAFLFVEKTQDQTVEPAQLQAIPESAFRSGTGSILPVPIASDTRYALRIYALPETLSSSGIAIRVFEMQPQSSPRSEEELIATVSGALAERDASLPPCPGPCDAPQVPLAPAIASGSFLALASACSAKARFRAASGLSTRKQIATGAVLHVYERASACGRAP